LWRFLGWLLFFCQVQLVSSGPGTLKPGQNLNLLYKVTDASITNSSYTWHWVCQPPGKGFEWIARIYPTDGRKWHSSSLQGHTSIASDNSKNEYSLQLNSMSASDTAVYYCARDAH
uniref:Immunoglobulin V-set domain-containing protein n=1 Tax=Naja naja TaxID=35670 RepID=A0A8C6X7I8_NAJNA